MTSSRRELGIRLTPFLLKAACVPEATEQDAAFRLTLTDNEGVILPNGTTRPAFPLIPRALFSSA